MEFTDTVLPDHKKLSVTCKVYAVVMQLPKDFSKFEQILANLAYKLLRHSTVTRNTRRSLVRYRKTLPTMDQKL